MFCTCTNCSFNCQSHCQRIGAILDDHDLKGIPEPDGCPYETEKTDMSEEN